MMRLCFKLIGKVIFMVLTVALGSYLTALHSNVFEITYESCKRDLIKAKNFESVQQAAKCAQDKSVTLRVLGTVLFRDGSYLQ